MTAPNKPNENSRKRERNKGTEKGKGKNTKQTTSGKS
jgi:hypothetical protein